MGGTSPEEIARQHAEAVELVSCASGTAAVMPCMPRIDRGEIPLEKKRWPTCTLNATGAASASEEEGINREEGSGEEKKTADPAAAASEAAAGRGFDDEEKGGTPCISSRGCVDVGPLAALVREGYDDPAPNRSEPDDDDDDDTSTAASCASSAVSGASQGTNATTATKNKSKKKKKATTLYDRLLSLPVASETNLWDDANAARNNVHVTRPSHDAWGIKKIALIFCDDFLRDVYEMPWYHSHAEMREAVRPILDCLGVTRERVVRLLLASLPPGVTIPVHHDTGEWVRRTHRVHVPVIVNRPDLVLFRCGPTEDDMGRVDCAPGHVFEMNNQAKHAVSNCSDEHRVHLILDYVDETDEGDDDGGGDGASLLSRRRRIRLEKGERLLQTRRSIDRARDAGSRPCPSYMILGAQKAGTTSLYDYLTQHPLVVRARRRETHCLDWRWDTSLGTVEERRNHCLRFFHARELHTYPSCLTGESTPSYLLDSRRVIPRLREVFSHPIRFLVMMRDPVKRANSHYAMVTSLDGNPEQTKTRGTEWLSKSFEEVVADDLRNMAEDGLIPYWDLETSTVDADAFDRFSGTKEEDEAWDRYLSRRVPLNTGSHCPVSRGMYELQLRPWLRSFPPERFLLLRMEDMSSSSSSSGGGVQRTADLAFRHLGLPPYEVRDGAPKNARTYEPMDDAVRDVLRRFYEPHNRRLAAMAAETFGRGTKKSGRGGDGSRWWEDGEMSPWPYDG